MAYYVALIDKRTQREIPFSRVECDDALDATECEAFMLSRTPGTQTIIGYTPDAREALAPHVCRGCNCQFDRYGRLIA